MKVCVLLSGGMDSVTAFYDALRHHEVVGSLSFEYGSKHNHREIPFAQLHSERNRVPHQTISLGFINEFFKSDLLQSGGDIPEGHYADAGGERKRGARAKPQSRKGGRTNKSRSGGTGPP